MVILWTSSYSFMKESVLVADREAEVHMYQSSMLQIPSQHTTGENARQRRRRRPLPPELSIEREEIALELLCKGGVRKHSQHQSDARVELNATRQLQEWRNWSNQPSEHYHQCAPLNNVDNLHSPFAHRSHKSYQHKATGRGSAVNVTNHKKLSHSEILFAQPLLFISVTTCM